MKVVLGLGLDLVPTTVDDLQIIIEHGGDDGNHIGLDDASAHILGSTHADVDDALKGQVPLPHVHHVLTATGLEDGHQALETAIDGQDVTDTGRGGGQVSQVVQRIDQGEGGGAIQGSSIVQGGGDTHRRLVDVGDAKVDLPHDDGL